MTVLDRKLIRDLLQLKGQATAIVLVLACGVATFVMSLATLRSLELTQETYYEQFRFAQVFAHLKRAPKALAERIAEIPGVDRVQVRTAVEVTLDVADLAEPAVGRLISIPERPTPGLNDLYLRKGRTIEPGRRGEILINESFADAHKLGPGGRVAAIINGRRQILEVVGVALSPEYVYPIREGDIIPDDERFGVFWMGEPGLADAFDMEGAFNDLALTLEPGASEAEIIQRLDRLIEPYGGLGAFGRDDQLSHKFVTNELRELRGVGLAVPFIFLAVGAFLLNIVLSRLVAAQREQIATLKAFGYTDGEIRRHFLKFVGLIVAAGVGLGTAVGAWMGWGISGFYARFFRFPVFRFRLDPSVVLLALAISASAAMIGTLAAIRRAIRLQPAEAMRPEPPASYRPTSIERWVPRTLVSPAGRMILRRLGREPFKAFLSVLGIALSVAVLVVGNYTADAVDDLMDFQFHEVQRHDLSLTFVEPTSARAISEVRHLPGVIRCEPFRAVAVRLRSGHRTRRAGILGLEPGTRLYRPLDASRREVSLPERGLMLSTKLAEILHVQVGDLLTIEVLEAERRVYRVPVESLVSDYEGLSVYMRRPALNRLLREGPTVSGAFLSVDSARSAELYSRLKATPRVASVSLKRAMLESFRRIIAESLLKMQSFVAAFAAIIAFGVVYNGARISLAERSRELATLRVIGFTRGEVSAILLGELAILTLIALPVGLAIGAGFAAMTTQFYDTELFRIPMVIYPTTFAMGALVTIVSAIASGWVVRRRIDELDLIAVLKTKE